jgi:hypothetical protein
LPGKDCPSAVSSMTANRASAPTGVAPTVDPKIAAADAAAVSKARDAMFTTAAGARRAAGAVASATLRLQQAKTAVAAIEPTDTTDLDYDVSSSQSDVDFATSTLASDRKTLAAYQDDQYMGSYYQDQVDTDVVDLATAKAALATAKAKVVAVKAKDRKVRQAAGKKVTTMTAEVARAETSADKATVVQAGLQKHLDAANQQQAAHLVDLTSVVGAWNHQHRVALDTVEALNTLRGSCVRTAHGTVKASAGLVGVAVLLLIGNLIAVRRAGGSDAGPASEAG